MAEPLKNVYTKEYISKLSKQIKIQYENFDEINFIKSVFSPSWSNLELKDRMRHIAINLNKFLPLSYINQIEILKIVSKEFSSFEAMFFQDFVEVYGLNNFEVSMKALEVFTIDSSSEFAIRQFILKDEDKTIKQMLLWAKSDNEHIRRLSCEGCRPRLPWAVALNSFKKDPKKILQILELLKNDESLYVRKSVANNLNDISKDNPLVLIDFVSKNLNKSKNLDWICKHASRTLLKKADKKILELFSYTKTSHIQIKNFKIDKQISIGDNLNFSFDLSSFENLGNLRIEYIIDYVKANGKYSKKVYILSQNNINKKTKSFFKKQSFKNMSTRKHYLGSHEISIVINGKVFIKSTFLLK